MAELSEACRKYLAARWDDGLDAIDDPRFTEQAEKDDRYLVVIEIDIEDMSSFPELRGYTAVAISQDGAVAYLTKEEAEDDDEG